MSNVPALNLTDYIDAVKAALLVAFPTATITDHKRVEGEIKCPAILLDIVSMEPTEDGVAGRGDVGTGQISLNLKLEARCVLGFKGERQQLSARSMAASVAACIFSNRWQQPVSPALVTGVFPDEFDPDLDRYHVMRVDFEQSALFGVSVWAPAEDDPPTPDTVYAGFSPEIGPPHVDDYLDLMEGRVSDEP